MSDETPLGRRMRELSKTHERGPELIKRADELDSAQGIKNTLAAWSRARKLWCECTGEPLV